jgi:manganese oxidase
MIRSRLRVPAMSVLKLVSVTVGSVGLVILANATAASAPTAAAPLQQPVGTMRVYFIAANEVDWDYAPSGTNQITGQPFGETDNVFVQRGANRIGKVYRKSLYREYTDDTFRTPKATDPRWQHLGMLGPVIHAEVGDTIEVHFKNNTGYPSSMHPHGVRYAKDGEGAPYNDGTSGAAKS